MQASVRDIVGLISRLHQEGHRVVVVSHSKAQTDLVLCIEAGARGYLSQYIAETELLTAVRTVAAGRSYFSTDFNNQGPQETPPHITDREREILQLVATGATVGGPGGTAVASPATVGGPGGTADQYASADQYAGSDQSAGADLGTG